MTQRECRLETIERLFARGELSRAQFVQGLAALGLSVSALEALVGLAPQPAAAQTLPARYLVLIVLDAFRPDYFPLASMPTVSALARSGMTYDRAWVGQIESLSPAGHATLGTGCLPKHTGVLGFEWRDPATRKEALDGWPPQVLAGALERDLRESGVDSIALALKNSDSSAKIVSISSEKVYAADALGGWAADYILYHRRDQKGPTLIPSAVPGHVPPASFFRLPGLTQTFPLSHFTDWDYLSTVLALASIKEFHPRALLVNLPGADVYGHPYGGPATPAVFAQVAAGVDRNIGRIVQAYQDTGIYDQTIFVIVADHGMVPNVRAVDGALTREIVRQAGGDYLFHTGGTAAYIYLNNGDAASRAVAQAMAKVPNVAGAYYLMEKGDVYYYDKAPGTQVDPALAAAHHALLATFAGPRAPDVVAAFRENTIGSKLSSAHGDHGGLNWGAQHVPLILSGPGVASNRTSGFPARLIDVAPTVLRLLGLPARAMDGTVLSDALTDATADEVAAQSSVTLSLLAAQTALLQQSADNIAEDAGSRLRPPPSLMARP